MQKYLEATEIVDYNNKKVHALAMSLSKGCKSILLAGLLRANGIPTALCRG